MGVCCDSKETREGRVLPPLLLFRMGCIDCFFCCGADRGVDGDSEAVKFVLLLPLSMLPDGLRPALRGEEGAVCDEEDAELVLLLDLYKAKVLRDFAGGTKELV